MDERKDAMREEIPNKGGAFSIVLIPSNTGVHSVHSLIELNAIHYVLISLFLQVLAAFPDDDNPRVRETRS